MKTPQSCIITAISHEGLSAQTLDGKPARLAVIDDAGNIIEAGQTIADGAWTAAVECYKQRLIGMGHLRIITGPGLVGNAEGMGKHGLPSPE